MSDWLNQDIANQGGGDAGYLEPTSDDLLWDDGSTATLSPTAPAAPAGDPYSVDPFASTTAAPAHVEPTYDAGYSAPGSLSVQAPMLDDLQPTINTVGGSREDLSNLVLDVEVPVEVCFGNASLTVEDFLEMGPGSVVELDREIAQPIELRVRGKLIAHGQLVTINGNYGLRITETVDRGDDAR